ncbi:MAG: site-specific DNA-methyltransferase [Clostridiales bacterium]|nr:site-specific DNA-methyltransferase [Clostridiales bacterium]
MIEILGSHPISKLYYGDATATTSSWLEEYSNTVDLVYIDLPNISGYSYKHIQKVGANQGRITHSDSIDMPSSKKEYFLMIEKVIKNCKALLIDTGNICVHTSYKTIAPMRLMLDKIFGKSNFVNEIIWSYEQTGNPSCHFKKCHDTLFLYRKSKEGYFNPIPSSIARGKERRNHMKKNAAPDGRVYYSIITSGKEYKYYEDDLVCIGDVWDDIDVMLDNDRYRYEGQKPEELLERILLCASPENALICDPFAGSGTTGIVATKTNRNFIMCDNSLSSIHLSKTNIASLGKSFQIVWEDINQYSSIPNVKFKTNFSSSSKSIHLDDYRIDGGEKYYSNTLLPTEDTLIDYWSVGRVVNDIYYIDDFDVRTHEKPTLGRYLHIKNLDGICCALTVDVFGNQILHEL